MPKKAILLEKKTGVAWTKKEIEALIKGSAVEVETREEHPSRIVVTTPLRRTFESSLCETSFTRRDVAYEDRWK